MKPILLSAVLLTAWWFVALPPVWADDKPSKSANTNSPVVKGSSMKTVEQFERLATDWQRHCDEHIISSDHDVLLEAPAYKELQKLGPSIVPLIIKQWKLEDEKETLGPPWQYLLRDLTKKEVITRDDRLTGAGLSEEDWKTLEAAGVKLEGFELPGLERTRWFQWWENEGQKRCELDGPRCRFAIEGRFTVERKKIEDRKTARRSLEERQETQREAALQLRREAMAKKENLRLKQRRTPPRVSRVRSESPPAPIDPAQDELGRTSPDA